jgi:hydroxymethylpyrimidine pyrophosphatase-like HAD family hydrolase
MNDQRPIVFTDLDDTLFQNDRRVEGNARDGLLAISRSMAHATCMTVKQQNLLRWLVQTTELIPVTARSIVDFSDIDIDFGGSRRIVANGAVILAPDGRHDEEWDALMASEMAPYQDRFEAVLSATLEIGKDKGHILKSYVTSEFGMSISALFRTSDGSTAVLEDLRSGLSDLLAGWHVHLNGNTLAFTPPPVSKRRAVEHLLSKADGAHTRPVIGMGDSLSDLGFMTGCDFISIPRGSQISSAFAN